MSTQHTSGLEVRIYQVVFALLFVGLFLVAMPSLMRGSVAKAGMVVGLVLGTSLVFALDRLYWVMVPVLTMSGLSIRGLPFSGQELGCLTVVAVYFVRLGLGRERSIAFNRDLLIVFPMMFWMMLVFMLNPVGMAMFGSETIGGRFYFQIGIGFLALLVLSTVRVGEREARILFYGMLVAATWSLLRGVIFPGTDPDALVMEGETPERSARYAFTTAAVIFMLLYARYPLSWILRSPGKIFGLSLLALLAVYSGKRRAFGMVALVPYLRAFLTGRERLLTMVVTVVASVFLLFAVVGDGGAYRLPKSARRALSIVAPKYRNNLEDGGIYDVFRHHMRQQARNVIRDNPWFGRKGFAMSREDTRWILFGRGRTSLWAGHAYAGNWHNAWYAYAADFGIPCLVFWTLFVLYLIYYAIRAARTVVNGTWLPVCCLFYVFRILVDLLFSYTTGHSATTSQTIWTEYGMLLAVVRGYQEQQRIPVA